MALTLRKNLTRKLNISELDDNFEYLESISGGSLEPTLIGTITYEDINDIESEIKKIVFEDVLSPGDKLISLYNEIIVDFEAGYAFPVDPLIMLNKKGFDLEFYYRLKDELIAGELNVWAVIIPA